MGEHIPALRRERIGAAGMFGGAAIRAPSKAPLSNPHAVDGLTGGYAKHRGLLRGLSSCEAVLRGAMVGPVQNCHWTVLD